MFRLKRLSRSLTNHWPTRRNTSTTTRPRPPHYSETSVRHFVKHRPRNRRRPAKQETKKAEKEPPRIYTREVVSSIYKILKYSSWEDARGRLRMLGVKWDSHIVNRVLKAHPPMEKAWLFFNWVDGFRGFKHDHFTYTTMLDIFGEAGRLQSMNHVFEKMRERGVRIDAVTYTSVMHWVSHSGDVDGAVKVWEEMRENRCFPTVVSYTAYMKILLDNGKAEEASRVYKEMIESGIKPSCHTYTILMDYLFVAGRHQEALAIFEDMQEAGVQPDKAACNILVERCSKTGQIMAMTKILQYMGNNCLVLRYPVFLEALKTLKDAGESDALLRQVNPHFLSESLSDEEASATNSDDDPLDRVLILFLLAKKNFTAVDHMVAGLKDKKRVLVSWVVSTIIQENCSNHRPDGALMAFEYSKKLSVDLERTAYLSLIGVLIKASALMKAVDIVEDMTKAGYSLGAYLAALLIHRLGCARRIKCAAKIFDLLQDDERCTAAHTALIRAYFTAGNAEKALEIYESMKKKDLRPSLGTYNVILDGLERTGKASEAEPFRKERKSLQTGSYNRNPANLGEKICDLLFAGDVVL